MEFRYVVSAEKYASARPTYPAELITAVAQLCRHHEIAWEAGCGTGQATLLLAKHFRSVIATDASAEQIDAATPVRNVRYLSAPAEDFRLPPNSMDLVYVAQALHWFDRKRFIDTAFDNLKEGGVFAYSYYSKLTEDSPRASLLSQRMDHIFNQFIPSGWNETYITPDFSFPGHRLNGLQFTMSVEWNLLQTAAYLSSRVDFTNYERTTGDDATLPLLRELSEIWRDPEQTTTFNWPITLISYRKS